jgi:hypothetical protein
MRFCKGTPLRNARWISVRSVLCDLVLDPLWNVGRCVPVYWSEKEEHGTVCLFFTFAMYWHARTLIFQHSDATSHISFIANSRQHQIRSVIKLVASPTTFRQFPLPAIGHESMTNTWRWPASKLFFVPASCPTHDLCTAWYHLTSPICALNCLSLVGYVLETLVHR